MDVCNKTDFLERQVGALCMRYDTNPFSALKRQGFAELMTPLKRGLWVEERLTKGPARRGLPG